MKRIIVYLLIPFAIIGLMATGIFFKELYLDSKFSEQYIYNCQQVKPGMTLEEAKIVMGGENYQKNAKSFIYRMETQDNKPYRFSLSYPTSGSSYVAEIYYNPVTGLVTKVDCYGH